MVKIKKLNHVGVAVKSVDKAIEFFKENFQAELVSKKVVEEQKQVSAIVSMGEAQLELMEPTDEDAVVAKFLESRGEGVHHISLAVDDLAELINNLEEKGVRILGKQLEGPGSKIAFIHPKNTFGILVEVVER